MHCAVQPDITAQMCLCCQTSVAHERPPHLALGALSLRGCLSRVTEALQGTLSLARLVSTLWLRIPFAFPVTVPCIERSLTEGRATCLGLVELTLRDRVSDL